MYNFVLNNAAMTELILNKMIVRVPKPNDIGLIFDVSVTNSIKDNTPELLEFNIVSEKPCRLELGSNCTLEKARCVVGGNFGAIEAGVTETVSIIWPTTSLYNRVGCCAIVITSTNPQKEKMHINKTIRFDTTFAILDPQSTGLRKSKNFKDCNNFDLDYLKNCTPVNCEERYFGLRNFFNHKSQHCEEVPHCRGSKLYDHFTNKCVDSPYNVTKDDVDCIKKGNFRSYDQWVEKISKEPYEKYLYDTTHPNIVRAVKSKLLKRENCNTTENEGGTSTTSKSHSSYSYWIKGLIDGMMIVFATVGIYILICFAIFLITAFISRRQNKCGPIPFSTPPSENDLCPMPTRSCILSQR